MMGGSDISWTICRSFASRSRQITTQAPHHSIFTNLMLFLMPNQQHQSTEGFILTYKGDKNRVHKMTRKSMKVPVHTETLGLGQHLFTHS